MRLSRYIYLETLIILLTAIVLSGQSLPVNLKGQVVTYNQFVQRDVPVRFAQIDLFRFDPGEDKWIHFRSSNTNTHGYYFLYTIPPGRYKIVVKNKKSLIVEVNPAQRKNQFKQIPDIKI